MNRKETRKMALLAPMDRLTLAPLAVGALLGLGSSVFDMKSAWTIFFSISLALLSAGIYCHRLFIGWEENSRRALEKWRQQEHEKKEQDINRLYKDLKKDGDRRTEALLQDLRALARAFELDASVSSDLSVVGAFDMVSDVDKLFVLCVNHLKQTLELWRTASEVSSATVKKRLLEGREELIKEVQITIEHVGRFLGDMKKVSMDADQGAQLMELRNQLDQHLHAAQMVEERMRGWDGSKTVSAEDEKVYLREADKT